MQKPLIGLTAGEIYNRQETWSPVTYGQSYTYIDSIIRAGGIPIIIPLTTDKSVLDDICSRLDGLVLSGGNDVSPELYGAEPYEETVETSTLRDATDIHILKTMKAANKPILAICRGMQILNVEAGGTLYQHIPTDVPSAQDHKQSSHEKDITYLAHPISIEPNTKLANILGQTLIDTNTHHHQSVKDLGTGLRITARAADGIVEGIETNGDRFIIGVQSHPEALGLIRPDWGKLFTALVDQAR